MRPLKVALVCQWYKPEPVSQPSWIVEALNRLEARVQVLTGIPNYPAGRVLAGYSALSLRRDVVDGVPVRRTPLYPSHGSGTVGRILNYLSWAVTSALFGQAVLKSADVSLVYSSPATAALAAMVARVLHRTPYVLLVQDVWPDSITASGSMSGLVGRCLVPLVSSFASLAYRDAARIVVTSPGMKPLLQSRGVPAEKISVTYNWVTPSDDGAHVVGTRLRGGLELGDDDFVLMYAGNLGAAQDLRAAILGMALLDPHERCHLVLVGEGVERASLQWLAAQVCPARVHFVGAQPRDAMTSVMDAADVQLVALADRPLFRVTTPSKLQSVLAAGKPVLAMALGDVAATVLAAHAGLAVAPGRPNEFAQRLQQLRGMAPDDLVDMGLQGRRFYEEHMSESRGANRLMAALREAADERVGRLSPGPRQLLDEGWN
jgi:colanic acid biosynthesis glycosyl transferase WcaI